MRVLIFAVIICIGISPIFVSSQGCVSNNCTTSQTSRPQVTAGVVERADYILETTRTVSTIGTSLWEFIEKIDDRYAIRDLLDSILSPTLTYLAGLNDTILRPFYPEIFQLIDDLAYELDMDLSSNPAQTATNLVDLLERGINLGVNISRVIFANDPAVESVLSLVTVVLNFPGLRDNITCILTEKLSDPSIGEILTQLNTLFNMTKDITIARPILQLFSDSNLFYNKFQELFNSLPNSNGVSLCVDAFLTNLVCPFESRYCHANCEDTLVYCIALLSQSLQDFSDVLDAVAILAVGYVNSDEFEMYFNQIRNELISTVNSSIAVFVEFNIVEFVNMTLTDCNLIPLIGQLLPFFNVLPANATLDEETLEYFILSAVSGATANIYVDPTTVLSTIEQQLNLDYLLSLTNSVYYLPNGFILDRVLSLGIYYTLLYRPPQGCGTPYTAGVSPLTFLPYYQYDSSCFDGNSVVSYDPNSYFYGYPLYYFSFYSINYSNQAANRTCTFNMENFFNATIVTDTNLCEAFVPLYQQSIDILRNAIGSYGKLQFCNSFIGNATPPLDCITNDCITSQTYRPQVTAGVVEGADYILETTRTVSTIGTSLWEFIEKIDDRYAIRDLLDSILSPTLTYLAGLNDTILRPFYPEIFQLIDDLAYELDMDLSSNPAQTATDLVNLLERGINLGVNISRVIFANDPAVESVLSLVTVVLNFPGLRDNITCILTEKLSDPSIGEILTQLNTLFTMTKDITIARPILQLFSDSNLFYNKFQELFNSLPNSNGVSLCVDAFLTNLVCPFESRYCHANCEDTLVYCIALLSQSLQDFSDVLDAVAILAVGYVNSDEFEMYFNQIRNELISTVNSSIAVFVEFNIVEFVNMTLTDCNLIPLIGQLLPFFNVLPANATLDEETLEYFILSAVSGATANIYVDPTTVLSTIEQQLNLYYLLSLTNSVYYLPNGFILDEVLSLGIYYTLLYRPPQGCGTPYTAGVSPLTFLPYYQYDSSCFDGNSVVSYDPNSYFYGYPLYYFSFYSINYSNQAANRTCTFNMENFFASRLNTTVDLCTVFLSLNADSRTILRNSVTTYYKFPFCRSFILVNVTEPTTAPTTVTTPATTPATTPTVTTTVPIIPPMVSFPTAQVTASVGIPFDYPCTGTGTNVMVNIVLLNDGPNDGFSQVFTQSGSTLVFNSSMPGNFTFVCTGVNSIGSDTAVLTIKVRPLSENIEMITSIMPGEVITPEEAAQLVSLIKSVLSSDAIQDSSDNSDQLLTVTGAVVDSLTDGRNISEGEAESVLLLLSDIETIPEPAGTTEPPRIDGEVVTLNVPRSALIVAQAVGQVASNLAIQAVPGDPPRNISSNNINITIAAFVISSVMESIPISLQSDEAASVDLPSNNFPAGAIVNIGASVRRSQLRIIPSADGTVEITNTPQLNSDLVSLDVIVNSQPVDLFLLSPNISFSTSSATNNAEQSCVFINVATGQFETSGLSTIILSGSVACQPVHLTSFGVLIRAREIQVSVAETLALSIISYLLLSISLIFLIISIIFFLVSSKKFFKVETNILYFNFAISLTLAISVFIFGIQTAKDSLIGCSIVAFFLHYFWLSVFSWSFAISIFMIYILYFGVFQRRRIWWLIMILAWGLPLPIVVITIAVGVARDSYATIGDHCFLSYSYGLIWGFLGPFVILITCAMIGAIFASVKIFLTVRSKGDSTDDFDAMKKMAVTLLVLIPVLSIPWIIGVINAFITISITTTILEWVSILLTAPLGLLFFLLVVLRNAQVQEVVFRRKPKGLTSSQQTSGTTASKYTLPSKAKGSSDAAFEKVEPASIINPAYESSTVIERSVDEKELKKSEAAENVYTSYPEHEDSKSKAYTSLAVEEPAKEQESALHKYAEL